MSHSANVLNAAIHAPNPASVGGVKDMTRTGNAVNVVKIDMPLALLTLRLYVNSVILIH